jgi:hypothetical protein
MQAMQRTYLALAGLGIGSTLLAAVSPTLVRAAGLFDSRPVEASQFAVLARPVGRSDWNLLVLEQVQPEPRCWEARRDGLVDPSLNRFDYTGICNRYLDSNGYSLRVGQEDLATSHRLRLQQVGNVLLLQVLSPNEPTALVVGRGEIPRRDREGFVAIQLDPGWELQRRSYGSQTLNHLYFANATSLGQLIVQAEGNRRPPTTMARLGGRRLEPELPSSTDLGRVAIPGRAIALQVIPFRE